MQPPHIQQPRTGHISRLRAMVVERARSGHAATHPRLPTADLYLTCVRKWTASLTGVQRQRPYTLEEVIALSGLNGVYRRSPSRVYVARALMGCGFVQKRDWTVAGRNRRYWIWGEVVDE